MGKVRTKEPSDEMMEKIRRARNMIASKAKRIIKCPYCEHSVLVVFSDSKGCVQTKCAKCKTELLIDVANMRRYSTKIDKKA
ncbi:MAG: hypothetical protein R3Y47_12755 [Lachnospiraceae bacterium]